MIVHILVPLSTTHISPVTPATQSRGEESYVKVSRELGEIRVLQVCVCVLNLCMCACECVCVCMCGLVGGWLGGCVGGWVY